MVRTLLSSKTVRIRMPADALWLAPPVLALWVLSAIPARPAWAPWVEALLALGVLVAGRRVFRDALAPILGGAPRLQDLLSSCAAGVAFLTSGAIVVVHASGGLSPSLLDPRGGPGVFFATAATVIAARVLGRSVAAGVMRSGTVEATRTWQAPLRSTPAPSGDPETRAQEIRTFHYGPPPHDGSPAPKASWRSGAAARTGSLLSLSAVGVGVAAIAAASLAARGQAWSIPGLVALLVIPIPDVFRLLRRVPERWARALARSAPGLASEEAVRGASAINWILFDRRGVLTTGWPRLVAVYPLSDGTSGEELLHLATLAEYSIRHPLRDAIVDACGGGARTVSNLKRVSAVPGRGLRALYDGRDLLVGNLRLLEEGGTPSLPLEELRAKMAEWTQEGETMIFVAAADTLLGALRVTSPPRPEAREAVAALDRLGVRTAVRSGDVEESLDSLARLLGIDEAIPETGRDESLSIVQSRQAQGLRTALVTGHPAGPRGPDGVGGLSIRWDFEEAAPGEAAPRARQEVILPGGDLGAIPRILEAARGILRRRARALAVGITYQLLAVFLLSGALLPWTGMPPLPGVAAVLGALCPLCLAAPRRPFSA